MLIFIFFAIVFLLELFVVYVTKKNLTAAIWFCVVAGIAYVYIAVKQIIKMLFIPEKSAFSDSDINGFINTYVGWLLIVLVVSVIKSGGNLPEKIMPIYWESIVVGMFFVWWYFNILFLVGGLYIFLCFFLNFITKKVKRFNLVSMKR